MNASAPFDDRPFYRDACRINPAFDSHSACESHVERGGRRDAHGVIDSVKREGLSDKTICEKWPARERPGICADVISRTAIKRPPSDETGSSRAAARARLPVQRCSAVVTQL